MPLAGLDKDDYKAAAANKCCSPLLKKIRPLPGAFSHDPVQSPGLLTGAFTRYTRPTHACLSGNLFLHLAFPDLTLFGHVIFGTTS